MTELSSRDLELLSAYLDGQLSKADGARLESRIKNDPELRSVYDGLRQTRALLRKLPARRAPRNFRLTPQMVGIKKPTLSRSFPIFRLTSVLASILLFLGYAANLFSPNRLAAPAFFPYAANAPAPTAAPEEAFSQKVMEEPTEAPPSTQQDTYAAPTALPEGTLEPALDSAFTATPDPAGITMMAVPEIAIGANAEVTPRDSDNSSARSMEPSSRAEMLPVHPFWLFGLLGLAVVSGAGAFIVRKRAEQPKQRSKLSTREIVLIVLGLGIAALLAAGIYWMFLP